MMQYNLNVGFKRKLIIRKSLGRQLLWVFWWSTAVLFVTIIFSWVGNKKIINQYAGVTQDFLPLIYKAQELLNKSVQTISSTASLGRIDTETGLEKQTLEIRECISTLGGTILEIQRMDSGIDPVGLKRIFIDMSKNIDEQIEIVQKKIKVANDFFKLEERVENAIDDIKLSIKPHLITEELAILSGGENLLKKDVNSLNEFKEFKNNILILESIVSHVAQLSSSHSTLELQEESLINVRHVASSVLSVSRNDVTLKSSLAVSIGEILRFMEGPRNIFELKVTSLNLDSRIHGLSQINANLSNQLKQQVEKIVADVNGRVDEGYARVNATSDTVLFFLLLAGGVSIFLPIFFIVFFIKPKIVNRLNLLVNRTHEIVSGNLDIDIDTSGYDELSSMSSALEKFRKELIVKNEIAHDMEVLRERHDISLGVSGVGIWDWDVVNNVLLWDERMYQLYAVSEGDFSGAYEAWEKAVHPEDLVRCSKEIQQALSGEKDFDTEFRVVWPDQSIRNIRAMATMIRGEKNQPIRLIGANWDVTTQKKIEAELLHSNEELEKFAYISSHDLKAPLRAIGEISRWIEEDTRDILPEQSRADLISLQGRTRRMETLIEDLLNYSRLGSMKYDRESVNVEDLLKDIVELMSVEEGAEVVVAPHMPVFTTLKVPLQQIFRNLINNAFKHHNNPQYVKVEISWKNTSSYYEFSVADNGPGIEPKLHHKVFEMFSTLRPRDEVEGSGMGLAFVDKMLRNVGGSIRIESDGNKGATFVFSWPKEI